jgi:hypothetical protein
LNGPGPTPPSRDSNGADFKRYRQHQTSQQSVIPSRDSNGADFHGADSNGADNYSVIPQPKPMELFHAPDNPQGGPYPRKILNSPNPEGIK